MKINVIEVKIERYVFYSSSFFGQYFIKMFFECFSILDLEFLEGTLMLEVRLCVRVN